MRRLVRVPIPQETRERILALWEEGHSLKAIAEATGRKYFSVSNVIFQARMNGDPRAVCAKDRERRA